MGYLRSKGFFDVEKHDLDVFCRYVIPFFEWLAFVSAQRRDVQGIRL
jgi:hypothetical protein